MKPVKLTIEGVNSFIEPQTLDFEAVGRSNLFCISGKTGAGKTTIFDSIMLALYGKSTKGNLADVVNLSLMAARVVLEFTENGEAYTVERTIKCRFEKDSNGKKTDKRNAVSDCMLYKNGQPLAKGEEANDILLGIIGLEAAEFKNVYLLEQGEYAEFLKKTPAKQTEAVGKIFSLMRFGDVNKLAGDKSRELQIEIGRTESEIAGLGEASPELLRSQKDELKALRTKTTALAKDCETKAAAMAEVEKTRDLYISAREKQNAVKNLMLQSDDAKKKEFAAKTALQDFEQTVDPKDGEKLTELREELNRLSALNQTDKQYAAAVKEHAEKSAALQKKKEQSAQAEQRFADAAQKKQKDNDDFTARIAEFTAAARSAQKQSDTLRRVTEMSDGVQAGSSQIAEAQFLLMGELKSYKELAEQRAYKAAALEEIKRECEKRLGVIQKYAAEAKEISERLAAAEQAVSDAQKALAHAQLISHAAAIRAELHDGDKCPVCGGVYGGCSIDDNTDVAAAKEKLSNAEAQLKEITGQQAECVKHTERAKTDYENSDERLKSTAAEIDGLDKKLGELNVDPELYENLIQKLNACKTASDRARQSAEQWLKLEPEITGLKAELEMLTAAAAELSKKAESLKAELGDNCGKTDGATTEVKQKISELETKMKAVDDTRKKLSGDVMAATATVAAIEASLTAAKAECPVDMPEFDEEAYADKRDELERLKKQLAENEKDIAVKELYVATLTEKCDRQAELKKACDALKKRMDMYDKIAEITRGKAMLNYVAAEYIAEFTAVAGEILNELSSGKYTMSYDKANGFIVYDYLNEGKPRKTDTLSGGELFLASLSVAIAIARTQSRGNNAFFFLDEGFGTLDEDLIDVVYGALESLSRDCLVGVITHADALISRMPFTVNVVEATDTCGSKIVQ